MKFDKSLYPSKSIGGLLVRNAGMFSLKVLDAIRVWEKAKNGKVRKIRTTSDRVKLTLSAQGY